MSQSKIYQSIYDNNINKIRNANINIDNFLRGVEIDDRRGISLIIPCDRLEWTKKVYDAIHKICPEQYIYPGEDLHITVFDYIPGTAGFNYSKDQGVLYSHITEKILKNQEMIDIAFKGLVFSDSAGLITGYDSFKLVKLREKIRHELTAQNVVFKERYTSKTAHITFMRFIRKLQNHQGFLDLIEKYRFYNFGSSLVNEFHLVEHDWYNRSESLRLIKIFKLD